MRVSGLSLLSAWLLCGVLLAWFVAAPVVHASSVTHPVVSVTSPTCSRSGCNGLDPYSTHCAGSGASYKVLASVPITIKGINYGWDQLWWSATCQTNWARYSCSSSCTALDLSLYVHDAAIQGPVQLVEVSGHTRQEWLPTTPADAYVMVDCCPAYGFDTGYF